MFEWITGIVAGMFLLVGILAFFSAKVRSVISMVPFFKPKMWAIILIGVGLMFGGFAYWQTTVSNVSGNIGTATIGAGSVAGVTSTVLDKCVYTTSTDDENSNITLRADPNSNNVVYLDADEDIVGADGQTTGDISLNFTCTRAGNIQEDGAVHLVVKGDQFRSETDTTSSNVYNILSTTATPSSVWSGDYKQTVYMKESAAATTSSDQEEVYLTFSEGEKSLSVGIFGEVDGTSFGALNNYTTKNVYIYERNDDTGSETLRGTIIINKLPKA